MRKSANNTNKNNIETTIWNKDLAVGATLEGVYTFNSTFTGKFGETTKYVVVDPEGNGWAIFGSASIDRQFKQIPEGSYIWITYKGEESTKNGRTVKVYDIDFDDEYQN